MLQEEPWLSIFKYSAFFGAGVSILLAVSIAFVRARLVKNWFLLLTLLCVTMVESAIFFILSPLHEIFDTIWPLHLPALFLFGPATYLYYYAAMDDTFKMHKKHWALFYPGLVTFLLVVFWGFYAPEYRATNVLAFFRGDEAQLPDYVLVAGIFYNTIFYAFLLKETAFFWSIETLKNEFSARFFVFLIAGSMAIGVLAIIAIFAKSIGLVYLASFFITLMLTVGYVINQRFPEFFQALQIAAEKQKYSRSHLKDVNLEELRHELNKTMEVEKVFCQEDISLPSLAIELNLSPHQLSQYLNEQLNKNFSQFINEYRINEAKNMLQNDPDESILSIAYKVGFNSKSTFNAVFLKLAGVTPSEYRKSNAT